MKIPFINPSLTNPNLRVSSASCQTPTVSDSQPIQAGIITPRVIVKSEKINVCRVRHFLDILYMFALHMILWFNYKFLLSAKANVLYAMGWLIRFLSLKIGVISMCYKDLNNRVSEMEEFYFTTGQAFWFLVTTTSVI